MQRRLLTVLTAVSIMTGSDGTRAQSAGPRAFVLDQEARTLTALDVSSGALLQTAVLEGSPNTVLRTADGKRLLVLDRGTGRDAGEDGFQAKTKSALTVVDGETFKVVSRVELGWGLAPIPMLSPSGDRLAVICEGYTGRRPGEALPRELVTIDLSSAQVIGRLVLPRPATAFFSTPDGRTAVILSGRDKPKQTPPQPAELRIVDLSGPTLLVTIPLEGDPQSPVLAPTGNFVYLLDRGNPSGNPEKNVNGGLIVVSLDGRKLEAVHEVGSGPRGLVLDEAGEQVLVLSDTPPLRGTRDKTSELRIVRGSSVGAPIKVPFEARFIRASADGQRLVVASHKTVTALNRPELAPSVPMQTTYISAAEFAISPDGRRAFSVSDSNLWTYDLESGKEIGKITTGRWSERLLLAATAVAATAASKSSSRREAERKGQSYYYYTQYNLKDPNAVMAVRPDSKAVYVLNQQTSDVTIVDSDTGKDVAKIGAGGSSVSFLPGAGVALVIASTAVHAIDLVSNKKLDDLTKPSDPGGFTSAEISADGRFAVVQGRQAVLMVNGSSGKPNAKLHPFKSVVDIDIDWGVKR